jgi:hypothetical protein
MMMVMVSSRTPFRFGWDPEKRAVYSLWADGNIAHEQIAANVETPEIARFAVEMWTRGYRSRDREDHKQKGRKHFHILAETGSLGVRGKSFGAPDVGNARAAD